MTRYALCLLIVLVASPAFAAHNCTLELHPPVTLVDQSGTPVLSSGEPVSTVRSCGACHDAGFITSHCYHANAGLDARFLMGTVAGRRPWDYSPGSFGRWNPLYYRFLSPPGDPKLDLGTAEWIQGFGARHVGGGPALTGHSGKPLRQTPDADSGPATPMDPDRQVLNPVNRTPEPWDWQASGTVEMNCFLCHLDAPDNEARIQELKAGRFAWANTATLQSTGVVRRDGQRWVYDESKLSDGGAVPVAALGLTKPTSEHCGQCHGQTHFGEDPLQLDLNLSSWSTVTKGQVFSPQRMLDSGVNLEQKSDLGRPWDVHAASMLECHNCHYALNDPKSYEPTRRGRPRHLRYEPRRLDIAEFLHHPSHDFAHGHTEQGSVARNQDGTMRGCVDCHNAKDTHGWLPHEEVHLAHLSCEACHVAETNAPAIRMVDWTMISPEGEPRTEWRGLAAAQPGDHTSLVTGFRPVMLPKNDLFGDQKLSPYNLISAWYWVEGGPAPRPVRLADLQAALLAPGGYHPDVLKTFDADGDGQLSPDERVIDQPEKMQLVRQRLEAVGVVDPHIEAEVDAYGLHHGVGSADSALRDCLECHSSQSRLGQPFVLASFAADGVLPKPVGDGVASFNGTIQTDPQGRVVFQPNTRGAGLYVVGHDYWPALNGAGVVLLVGAVAAIGVHTGLRIRSHRRSKAKAGAPSTTDPQ